MLSAAPALARQAHLRIQDLTPVQKAAVLQQLAAGAALTLTGSATRLRATIPTELGPVQLGSISQPTGGVQGLSCVLSHRVGDACPATIVRGGLPACVHWITQQAIKALQP